MSQRWLGDASGPDLLKRILVVDSDAEKRRSLQILLVEQGCRAAAAGDVATALAELAAQTYDGIFCSVPLVGPLLDAMRSPPAREPEPDDEPLLIATCGGPSGATSGDEVDSLGALDRGAFDCLMMPVEAAALAIALRRASKFEQLRRRIRAHVVPAAPPQDKASHAAAMEPGTDGGPAPIMTAGMVGTSEPMQEVFRIIAKIAQHKASVLIQGESGTGKELVARAIHDLSPRRNQRFVAINCGAIPANLLESELFGHRRGAFTDAVRDKLGLFEAADGGTLFLDEIGELPVGLQVKLLRAIQEEEIRRIGDSNTIKIDVRIIAATLRDLSSDVGQGRFREDLFYRLNVVPVMLPPLRDRRSDIRPLVRYFLERYARKHGDAIKSVSGAAMSLLEDYAWPGNIRELENTIERAMVLSDESAIAPASLPPKIASERRSIELPFLGDDLSIKKATRLIERELIRRSLERTGGNRTRAAELLEISHRALLYKIKDYEIDL